MPTTIAIRDTNRRVRLDLRAALAHGRESAEAPVGQKPRYPRPRSLRVPGSLHVVNVMQAALRTPGVARPFWPSGLAWNRSKRPRRPS